MIIPNYSTEVPEHNFYIAIQSCFLLVVNNHLFSSILWEKNQTRFQQWNWKPVYLSW